MLKQIGIFLLHLRPHYQLTVLSGGYVMSWLWVGDLWNTNFWLQFLNVHFLLFGGATEFNSFWDKDEGPIGGIKNPPKMSEWMRWASLGFMIIGALWALLTQSLVFNLFYLFSLLLFWLYSTPLARWKGKPELSLFVIGISTGSNAFWMGLEAAGAGISMMNIFTGIGVALVLTSMYPISQYFQIEEDRERGDKTFTIKYGKRGVLRFFISAFIIGVALVSNGLYQIFPVAAWIFAGASIFPLVTVVRVINGLSGTEQEYKQVMVLKFLTSASLVLSIVIFRLWIG